jgi:hypothetical protein
MRHIEPEVSLFCQTFYSRPNKSLHSIEAQELIRDTIKIRITGSDVEYAIGALFVAEREGRFPYPACVTGLMSYLSSRPGFWVEIQQQRVVLTRDELIRYVTGLLTPAEYAVMLKFLGKSRLLSDEFYDCTTGVSHRAETRRIARAASIARDKILVSRNNDGSAKIRSVAGELLHAALDVDVGSLVALLVSLGHNVDPFPSEGASDAA